MLDTDDFWSCFKYLEVNICDNLVFSVKVTQVTKSLFGKKKLGNLLLVISTKKLEKLKSRSKQGIRITNGGDNTDIKA
jgi:hypothetical protein